MRIAVLGTGIMGSPIARNLVRAGHEVAVWNRTPAKAAAIAGADAHATAALAVEGADAVLTMLSDAPAVLDVMQAARDGLLPGCIWVQCSTIGTDGTHAALRLAEDLGVDCVDAPVLGMAHVAEEGRLVVLASAPEALRGRCEEVFAAIGQRTIWVDGDAGGSRLKLVLNNWILALAEDISETFALAEALHVDHRLFLEAIGGGTADVPYVHLKGAKIAARDFAPQFPLRHALKDARLVLEAAAENGLELPLTELVVERLASVASEGYEEEDLIATFRLFRRGNMRG